MPGLGHERPASGGPTGADLRGYNSNNRSMTEITERSDSLFGYSAGNEDRRTEHRPGPTLAGQARPIFSWYWPCCASKTSIISPIVAYSFTASMM